MCGPLRRRLPPPNTACKTDKSAPRQLLTLTAAEFSSRSLGHQAPPATGLAVFGQTFFANEVWYLALGLSTFLVSCWVSRSEARSSWIASVSCRREALYVFSFACTGTWRSVFGRPMGHIDTITCIDVAPRPTKLSDKRLPATSRQRRPPCDNATNKQTHGPPLMP